MNLALKDILHNKLRFIMVNDNDFAKKWCDISNELLKKNVKKWIPTT